MNKLFVLVIAFFLGVLSGCESVIIDGNDQNPVTPQDKVGSLVIAGSLIENESTRTIEKSDTFPWVEVINAKASQVRFMNIQLTAQDGAIEYLGETPVVNGQFSTLINNVKVGNYDLLIGFRGADSIWLFSGTDSVTIVAEITTSTNTQVYLDNYCPKQILLTGLDPTIAETATPVFVIKNGPDNYEYTGTAYWFSGESNQIHIEIGGLPFDVTQPMALSLRDADGKQLARMEPFTFNPVAIAVGEVAIPFIVSNEYGNLELTIQALPPAK